MKPLFILLLLAAFVEYSLGQNVGIGTGNPQQKLHVTGKVFSSQGGFQFPDNTIQTTAANSQSTPESVSRPRGVGFVKFQNIAGPLDTLGLNDVSIVYQFQMDMMLGGAQPPFDPPETPGFDIIKQTDMSSPLLADALSDVDVIGTVNLYLTRKNSMGDLEIYYQFTLNNVFIRRYSPSLTPVMDDVYAHIETVRLYCEMMMIEDLDSGVSWTHNFFQ